MVAPSSPNARTTFLALLFSSIALACGAGEDPTVQGESLCRSLRVESIPDNVSLVLVVDDTLRRDVLGVYGGNAKTPHLDAFAEGHLCFRSALAPAPWTKPSIASLFTSLYPSQHRVASDPRLHRSGTRETVAADVLSAGFVTLAEVLRQAGYRTAAFVSNPWLEERHGFAQGFELYDDSFASWKADGNVVTKAALAWMHSLGPNERFFLYVHYIDTHRPYGRLTADELPELAIMGGRTLGPSGKKLVRSVIRLEDGSRLPEETPITAAVVRRAYERGAEDFDRAFGSLIDGLSNHSSWDRTAVFVTSDHGEALFEHGYGNHGTGLYFGELEIPFLARMPGVTPARGDVECLVSLIDVFPSACAYLGLRPPPGLAGWSFLDGPLVEGAGERRYLVAEGTMVRPTHRSIQNARYKLIFEPAGPSDPRKKKSRYALFDLEADPEETRDLCELEAFPEGIEEIFNALVISLASAAPAYDAPEKSYVPIDEESVRQLEALGYLGEE